MLLGVAAPSRTASAQPMIRPVGVSTDMGTFSVTNVARLIDGTGLSSNYTSGSTLLGSYTATHNGSISSGGWGSTVATGNIDFDLGGTFFVQAIALWRTSLTSSPTLKDFWLEASGDASFTTTTRIPGPATFFTSVDVSGGTTGPFAKEVFTFAPTQAAFVRLHVINARAGGTSIRLGEVAFAGTASTTVPEPGTLALLALGGGALVLLKRRRR